MVQVPRPARKRNAAGFADIGAQHCSEPVWFRMCSKSVTSWRGHGAAPHPRQEKERVVFYGIGVDMGGLEIVWLFLISILVLVLVLVSVLPSISILLVISY